MKNLKLMLENLMLGKCGTTLAMLAVLSIIGWTLSAGATRQRAAANMPPELDTPCMHENTASARQPARPHSSARKNAPRNLPTYIFDSIQIFDYARPFNASGHTWADNQSLFDIYAIDESLCCEK